MNMRKEFPFLYYLNLAVCLTCIFLGGWCAQVGYVAQQETGAHLGTMICVIGISVMVMNVWNLGEAIFKDGRG